MKKKLLLICSIFISVLSNAQTIVPGGNVSGKWTLAGSPYLVKNSIVIPKDCTLTIQPGVKVSFLGHFKLLVQGRILAIGTEKDSIRFTTDSIKTGWYGIRFDNTPESNDSSKIKYSVIEWGSATNNTGSDTYGGGLLFNNFSKVSVRNCAIRYCTNFQISCINSSPHISYCNISNSKFGGAFILMERSVPLIDHNVIRSNNGPGIMANLGETDSLSILYNTISYNNEVGIKCSNGYFNASYNTITHNNKSNISSSGGIHGDHNSGTISHNKIAYNGGEGPYGGGIFCYFFGGTISHNFIANNTAESGAGIFCTGMYANPLITNNVIANNTANNIGGGIYCVDHSNPTLVNNTIVNNKANYGAGMYCDFSSLPSLTNCILYGNKANAEGDQVYLKDESSDPDFYFCDIQGGKDDFGLNGNFFTGQYVKIITDEPQLVAPTTGAGTSYDGLSAKWNLLMSSPCIDQGNPVGNYPLTDIGNNNRIRGERIDIGAYEYYDPTGIKDNKQLFTVSIFPNPFNSYTSVQLPTQAKEVSYKIFNLMGQELKAGQQNSGNNSITIYKDDLPAGIYYIQLTTDKLRVAKEKIVITD